MHTVYDYITYMVTLEFCLGNDDGDDDEEEKGGDECTQFMVTPHALR